MCIVCSTIPAVMALGVSAQAKQNQAKKEAAVRGEVAKKPAIPAGPTTTVVLALLLIAAALVHSKTSV